MTTNQFQYQNPNPQIYGDGIFANYIRAQKSGKGDALAQALRADAKGAGGAIEKPGDLSYATKSFQDAGKMNAGWASGLANVLAGVSAGLDNRRQNKYENEKAQRLDSALKGGDPLEIAAAGGETALVNQLAENELKKQQAQEKMAFDREENDKNRGWEQDKFKTDWLNRNNQFINDWANKDKQTAAQRKFEANQAAAKRQAEVIDRTGKELVADDYYKYATNPNQYSVDHSEIGNSLLGKFFGMKKATLDPIKSVMNNNQQQQQSQPPANPYAQKYGFPQ